MHRWRRGMQNSITGPYTLLWPTILKERHLSFTTRPCPRYDPEYAQHYSSCLYPIAGGKWGRSPVLYSPACGSMAACRGQSCSLSYGFQTVAPVHNDLCYGLYRVVYAVLTVKMSSKFFYCGQGLFIRECIITFKPIVFTLKIQGH